MEERKRPALDDTAPPSKRQAIAVNGNSSHPDADMPWKDDIEVSAQAPLCLVPSHLLTSISNSHWFTAIPKRCYSSTNAGVQEGEDDSRIPVGFHDETIILS